jgi:septal ring factor EnvC (AmiA/AmiB activator)
MPSDLNETIIWCEQAPSRQIAERFCQLETEVESAKNEIEGVKLAYIRTADELRLWKQKAFELERRLDRLNTAAQSIRNAFEIIKQETDGTT